MAIEVKAYETKNAGQTITKLVVDDGAFKYLVPTTSGEKVDIDATVAVNQKICLANDSYIQAVVAKLMGKTSSTKEVEASKLYTAKAAAEGSMK